MKEVSKLDVVQFSTKDGSCSARFAPWSAENKAVDRASGEGIWVHIWNLPLHGVVLERNLGSFEEGGRAGGSLTGI